MKNLMKFYFSEPRKMKVKPFESNKPRERSQADIVLLLPKYV